MMKVAQSISVFMVLYLSNVGAIYAMNAKEVYQSVSQSVYTVYSYEQQTKERVALASGIAISPDVLVTNCHVAKRGNIYQIKQGKQFHDAELVQRNYKQDLCYLKVPNADFNPVKLGQSAAVVIGESVYAVGNPHGLEKSITKGIVSNKHHVTGGMLLQTDATISFGSSGGGLFNENAELIGVTRAGHRFKDIAFAVPADWIANYLAQVDIPQLKVHAAKQLATFGEDNIGVYRSDQGCFIYFLSQSAQNKLQGSLIWFPDKSKLLYFLPLDNTADASLKTLLISKALEIDREPDDGLHLTPSFMLPVQIIMKEFDEDPIAEFKRGKDINMHYPDYDYYGGMSQMTFGLMGFSKAYEFYQRECGS